MNYRHACCGERDRLEHGLTDLLPVRWQASPREPAVRIREELVGDPRHGEGPSSERSQEPVLLQASAVRSDN
jgi:hypothetical protein